MPRSQILPAGADKLDEGLWLIGLDDSEEDTPNLNVFSGLSHNDIKIGLFHSPRFFDEISEHKKLNLAGHSHGSQI